MKHKVTMRVQTEQLVEYYVDIDEDSPDRVAAAFKAIDRSSFPPKKIGRANVTDQFITNIEAM